MREEIEKYFEQAKEDLKAGIKNLENEILFVAAFLFQQAAEKALKALWIKIKKENPPITHNLLYLASSLNLPDELIKCAKILTPHAIISRYPSKEFAPYEIYTKEEVLKLKECAEKIIKWIEERLK